VRTVAVPLGERSYPVVVGAGASGELAALVPGGVRRVAVVTQRAVGVEVDTGRDQRTFAVPDGEGAKTLSVVEDLCRGFSAFGLTRADCVVGIGGGVVTDLAGFAAAVYMRGVAVVHVATSLLGMIDAAIGGKTGVNLPEGKNLVGAFWQPAAVVCDLDHLATLPPRQLRSGRGEMAKYAFIGVPGLLELGLEDQVAACVACKAEVVGADERESGGRAILNYGHTLGHALETVGGYTLLHGEAVAVGLSFAARLACRLGRIDPAGVERHDRVLDSFELPTRLPEGARAAELISVMGRDKKAVDGLTFVLDGPGGLEVVAGVDRRAVEATLVDMGAR